MSDLLRIDHINSLPQPFFARLCGDKDFSWPVHTICVETGLMLLDVCGKLDKCHIGDVMMFKDSAGIEHDPETFYTDYEPASPSPTL